MDDCEDRPDRRGGGHTRRAYLATVGTAATVGLGGCSLLPGRRGIALQWGDDASACVEPIERDRPFAAFYDYDPRKGRASERRLWMPGGTVTFLYRNAETGATSLCLVTGTPGADPYGGGRAILTVEGASGAEWQLFDDPPGEGGDAYATPSGSLGEAERVVWRWPDDGETDGGAIGPLGEEFDLTVTHRATATVGGESVRRFGLHRWVFLDGADPTTPIEIERFGTGGNRSPSIRLATGRC